MVSREETKLILCRLRRWLLGILALTLVAGILSEVASRQREIARTKRFSEPNVEPSMHWPPLSSRLRNFVEPGPECYAAVGLMAMALLLFSGLPYFAPRWWQKLLIAGIAFFAIVGAYGIFELFAVFMHFRLSNVEGIRNECAHLLAAQDLKNSTVLNGDPDDRDRDVRLVAILRGNQVPPQLAKAGVYLVYVYERCVLLVMSGDPGFMGAKGAIYNPQNVPVTKARRPMLYRDFQEFIWYH